MRNRSGTLLRTLGVGGLALVSGVAVSIVGGATAGPANVVVGATVALIGLLPVLRSLPFRAPARVPSVRPAGHRRAVRRVLGFARGGSARAAAVRRHTSMICC
jgi:hypothetical protein